MARIFLDSGVLLEGGRGTGARQEAALAVLEDPEQTFLTSPFVYLETVPKARHYGRFKEVEFYEAYFGRAESLHDMSAIFERGIDVIATASAPWTRYTSRPPNYFMQTSW